jgi:hypothetical protein
MSSKIEDTPDQEEIWKQLRRIQRSARFKRASTSLKFLEILVMRSALGFPSSEEELGVMVFDRRVGWFPNADATVRNGRYNLQAYLKEYYVDEGREDPVIIEISFGKQYLATFIYNPGAHSIHECAEGLGLTRKMFLSGGAALAPMGEHGRDAWFVIDKDVWPEEKFSRALIYDPSNLEASAGRAEARLARILFRGVFTSQALRLAERDIVETSERVKTTLWRAHVINACVRACLHDWDGAAKEFVKAEECKDPAEMDDIWSVIYLFVSGKSEKGLQTVRKRNATERDGLEQTMYGLLLYMSRSFDQAIEALDRADQISEKREVANYFSTFVRGCIRLAQGDAKEAERMFGLCNDKWDVRGFLAVSLAAGGKEVKARDVARCISNSHDSSSFQRALANMALGNVKVAITLLKDACLEGDPWMWFLSFWPTLDPLRSDGEFVKLNREMSKTTNP